jgi:hypothetical protein
LSHAILGGLQNHKKSPGPLVDAPENENKESVEKSVAKESAQKVE